MEENQTATYFLRSRLFTCDIMKNFNCNISSWFSKSKLRSHIGKHIFLIKITACMPLKKMIKQFGPLIGAKPYHRNYIKSNLSKSNPE